MPKPRSWHWDHFHTGKKQNKAYNKAYCNYCVNVKLKEVIAQDERALTEGRSEKLRQPEEQFDEALTSTSETTGRLDIMANHLIACQFVPATVKAKAEAYRDAGKSSTSIMEGAPSPTMDERKHGRSGSGASNHLEQRLVKKQKAFQVISVKAKPFTSKMQEAFEDQLLKAFVSSGTAFNKIDDPEVQRLYAQFMPSVVLPTRQWLEKEVLQRVVVQMEGEVQAAVKGGFATLSCDGWKDISRRHLVAFMLTVNGETHTLHVYDVSSKRKTAANLLPLMEKECDYAENRLGVILLGVCGDAAGDEHKSRLDLVTKHKSYLAADCWAHQVSLTLGDFIKVNPMIKVLMDEVVEVVKWFINHSYALGVFNEEQQSMTKKILALVIPVITRWTAYFLSMDRLVTVWKPLQITSIKHETALIESVGRKPKTKKKAQQVLSRVRNDTWWAKVVRVKTQIEPLAIAANVAQAGNIRCDQILLLLGKLYKTYFDARIADRENPNDASQDESHEVTAILNSIEKRWAKADQDLHIGAFFLNPYLNPQLLKPSAAVLMGVLRRLYEHLFQTKEMPSDLMSNIYDYHTRTNSFSSDNWPIKDIERDLKGPNGSGDPLKAWRLLDKKNPLVSLAERVLSFCPNSASAERLFSLMGNIKTKKRNRMHTQKLRDLAFLQLELRQQHAKQGVVRQQLKRSFGNTETQSSTSTSLPSDNTPVIRGSLDDVAIVEEAGEKLDEASDSESSDSENSSLTDLNKDDHPVNRTFTTLMDELTSQSDEEDSSHGTVVEQVSTRPSMPKTVRVFFGAQRHITIESLFNWDVEEGWDRYWFEGVKNCRQEMEFYELVASAERGKGKERSKDVANDSEVGASATTSIIID